MGILCSTLVVWDLKNLQLCEIKAAGTKAMHHTLDNIAAIDQGNGVVGIKCTAHGFSLDSHIGIRGTVNYDGTYVIIDENPEDDTNHFNIYATYVGEVIPGAATVRPELEPEQFFRVLEARLHLSALGGAAEDYTIDLASGQPAGAAHDVNLLTQDMNAQKDVVADWSDCLRFFNNNDRLIFEYANGNNKTWGLEVKYLVTG